MNTRYLALIGLLIVCVSVIGLADDADASDEDIVSFFVDGKLYDWCYVDDLSPNTMPRDPYKEGMEFVCWMNLWNEPVDLLTYDFGPGETKLWAYFEEPSPEPEESIFDQKFWIAITLTLAFVLVMCLIDLYALRR